MNEALPLFTPEESTPATPPNAGPAKDTPPASPAQQLTGWLCGLVASRQYGMLADLRRYRPQRPTEAHHLAAGLAPTEGLEEIYKFVAFLFAKYHAGTSTPSPGYGDMGTAMRRIGSGLTKGPDDPGARRLFARITDSRRIPLRHLQHAIDRARSCNTAPPSWSQLTDDLARWADRDRPTVRAWGRNFYVPAHLQKNRTQK
ncbi:type I-E CRISPR-associated protein Cse2/CasB [Streptomyces erythrochromogenes]|uniref:type I-E CRISPR-associated protein Cse2/CasB n=1 Tax=Streptomyces erythrochromogenes TaxID=285574 RepID=UPI0036BC8F4A